MLKILKFASSSKLTCALLAYGVILIFFMTLDQVKIGIDLSVEKYIESFFCVFKFSENSFFSIPFLGGYSYGSLLAINLIGSMCLHIKPKLKNLGLYIIHINILLLLFSLFCSSFLRQEYFLSFSNGQSVNVISKKNLYEIAKFCVKENHLHKQLSYIVDKSSEGKIFDFEDYLLKINRFVPSAKFTMLDMKKVASSTSSAIIFPILLEESSSPTNIAAASVSIIKNEETHSDLENSQDNKNNIKPSSKKTKQSNVILANTGEFYHKDGENYFVIRQADILLDFEIKLKKFIFEKHPKSNIPSNFSSIVELKNSPLEENKEFVISMNKPLRVGTYAFYQSSYMGEDTSVLQVVKNPIYLLPYIAVIGVFIGVLIHYFILFFKRVKIKK